MKSTDKPSLIETVIASGANASYVRTIPKTQTKAGSGEMSLDLGWPPECAIPVAAGGKYPQMADANGVLNLLSAAVQQLQARFFGAYNADFATAIGGYPLNAIVSDTTAGKFWVSTAEDNTTTPGADGAKWQNLFNGYATQSWANNAFVKNNAGNQGGIIAATMDAIGVPSFQSGTGNWYSVQLKGDYATNTDLNTETTNRTNADTNLQNQINNRVQKTGDTLTNGLSFNGDNYTPVYYNSTANNGTVGQSNDAMGLGVNLVNRGGLFAEFGLREYVGRYTAALISVKTDKGWSEYDFPQVDYNGGRITCPAGTMAVTSDLPLPVGQKIFTFTATVTNSQDIALPQAMSNVLFVTAQGGTDGRGTGMTTVNSWTNSTVNVTVASYHTGAPQRATITQTFLVVAIP